MNIFVKNTFIKKIFLGILTCGLFVVPTALLCCEENAATVVNDLSTAEQYLRLKNAAIKFIHSTRRSINLHGGYFLDKNAGTIDYGIIEDLESRVIIKFWLRFRPYVVAICSVPANKVFDPFTLEEAATEAVNYYPLN